LRIAEHLDPAFFGVRVPLEGRPGGRSPPPQLPKEMKEFLSRPGGAPPKYFTLLWKALRKKSAAFFGAKAPAGACRAGLNPIRDVPAHLDRPAGKRSVGTNFPGKSFGTAPSSTEVLRHHASTQICAWIENSTRFLTPSGEKSGGVYRTPEHFFPTALSRGS